MSTFQQIQALIESDNQKRIIEVQVLRNGSWVSIPSTSVKATIGRSKAGNVALELPEDQTDLNRSKLYEGEPVRIYRGVEGAPLQRCWTGFVDTREPQRDAGGLSRTINVTDYIKELNDAILLDGVVYDNLAPNDACIDALQRAISTQQFKPFDDNGNTLTNLASYTQANANPLVYFPQMFNDDGSLFVLPSGTLGSYTGNGASPYATFTIPTASGLGTNIYSTFELPNRYIIASTMALEGFTPISSTAFPPQKGQYILDAYNGLLYFNVADASTTASFTATYYDSPLFDFPAGTKIGDVITQILDKTGARWKVDGTGKISMMSIDTIVAPKKIYNPSQYVSTGVQISRDRRNVIVCLGWDGNCGGILAAKAVNVDDVNNAPPGGLGKRAYLVIQDQTWKTQYAVSKAVYYAVQQLSRRGKVSTVTVLDDPTLFLDDVIAFESGMEELSNSDFFYIDGLTWTYASDAQQTQAIMQITGTLLPGRGTIYLGPITGVTAYGSLDYSQDVEPITNCGLRLASINHAPNSDTLSGWTIASQFSLGTDGPGGAECFEITGTGANLSSNAELDSPAITVIPGTTYTLSWWIDFSQVTHGLPDVRIQSTNGATNYLDVNLGLTAGAAAGRYSTQWTCPAGVTSVRLDVLLWNGQSGGFIIANGQKLKFSQPQLEINTVASPYQSSGATTPGGGTYSSQFSIADGLFLTYTIGLNPINEWIDIYGSDGSHIVAESGVVRAGYQQLSLPMPVNQMTPGVMYVFRLWVKDSNGNIGVYRDFITARP